MCPRPAPLHFRARCCCIVSCVEKPETPLIARTRLFRPRANTTTKPKELSARSLTLQHNFRAQSFAGSLQAHAVHAGYVTLRSLHSVLWGKGDSEWECSAPTNVNSTIRIFPPISLFTLKQLQLQLPTWFNRFDNSI